MDHTCLKPTADRDEIRQLCEEALQFQFKSVCVPASQVALASGLLKGSPVKVCTVIGFPLGYDTPAVKAFAAKTAVDEGAEEIDMVLAIGALRAGRYDYVEDEIRQVVAASQGHLVKVIMETCYLTDDEKIKACELSKKAGADFVKTSTGFATGGAVVADIELLRKTVGGAMGVKASGGIRDLETALAMVRAGANRIGTSSGPKILKEILQQGK
ncbi:MAG TPA: deoxyribose-phosphate aldolase [Bacillota bacterium]|nr:deoxyribose-phosphate aldolase [Bacillota bacterium]